MASANKTASAAKFDPATIGQMYEDYTFHSQRMQEERMERELTPLYQKMAEALHAKLSGPSLRSDVDGCTDTVEFQIDLSDNELQAFHRWHSRFCGGRLHKYLGITNPSVRITEGKLWSTGRDRFQKAFAIKHTPT